MDPISVEGRPLLADLKKMAEAVRHLSEGTPPPLPPTDAELSVAVGSDIGQGAILFDRDGYSAGSRDLLLGRAREYLMKLSDVMRGFNDSFQPFQSVIDDFEGIPQKISDLKSQCAEQIAAEREKLDSERVGEDYRSTKAKYDRQVSIHPTLPNLKAASSLFLMDVNPVYLSAMALIGVAEWFINYDTIFLFFGVPVIAIGATVILAVCLSIIAHQHGVDLKQWRRKFGPGIERTNRPYGALALATVGLIGLLTVVGWMRYEAVMSVMQVQPSANLLGTQVSVTIDPEREVIISLGANVLAWLVGVFMAFFCHDPDPVYVATAIDFRKAERRYLRRKRRFDAVADRLTHQSVERIEEEQVRRQKFQDNPALREAIDARQQVAQHEQGFKERARAFLLSQGSRYKAELLRSLRANPGIELLRTVEQSAVPMSLAEFQGMLIGLGDDLLDRILPGATSR